MKKALLIFIFPLFALDALIIESDQVKTVKEHLTPGSLVVFDIDNTLIEPVQELGNDQWFRHRLKNLTHQGLSQEQAIKQCVLDWEAIRNVTEMQLVEEGVNDFISSIQTDEVPVMGLTTQGYSLALRTIFHLNKLGIDLSPTSPSLEDQVFKLDRVMLYKNGILFTEAGHKGHALFALLDLVDYHPKQVIFVNDKHSHLLPIEETCKERGIPFIGIRYSALDKKVASFNPEVAEYQWSEFGKIPSDEQALQIKAPATL